MRSCGVISLTTTARFALAGAVFAACLAAPVSSAAARPHLREATEINNGLFAVAIAREIKDYCPTINARYFRAFNFLSSLKRKARDMGYSDAEIEAYVDNDEEKARLRARGEAYLAAKGVSYDDPQSFCALGREEIQKSSQIGVLLRAK
ncbi:DUF5333 domain-containing protein [Shimia aestuarii]|uniref:DUF5333 domain-containing protein n=1 Tax=Shimia aestuarii TaxID=254406 RepID=UPI001FB36737